MKRINLNSRHKNLSEQYSSYFYLLVTTLIISIILYSPYIFGKKIYIFNDIGQDTRNSYWPLYEYFKRMILSGQASMWGDSLGVGNTVFSVWSWIFDPFNIILLIFSKINLAKLLIYIHIMKVCIFSLIVLAYLNIIGFNKKSNYIIAVIMGFNGYIVLWGQHYIFATMIIFCMVILYLFERYLKTNKWFMLACSIAFFAMHSIYFLFQFTIYLVIYITIRYFIDNQKSNLSGFAIYLIKLGLIYLAGLLMSAVFLLPQICALFNSARIITSNSWILKSLLQVKKSPEELIGLFRIFSNNIFLVGDNYYTYSNYYEQPILYFGLSNLLIIPLGIANSRNRRVKAILIISILLFGLMLLLPASNLIFYGFSAYAYRWTFIIILYSIYLAGYSYNVILNNGIDTNKILDKFLGVTVILFGVLMFILTNLIEAQRSQIIGSFYEMVLIFVFLIIYYILLKLFVVGEIKLFVKALFVSCIFVECIVLNWSTVNDRSTLMKQDLESKVGYYDYTNEALEIIGEDYEDYRRIEKDYLSIFLNDNLIQGYNATKAYSSQNQGKYIDFLNSLEIPLLYDNVSLVKGLNGFSQVGTFQNVHYLLSKTKNSKPYGYEHVGTVEDVDIYKNTIDMPLGTTYDTVITKEMFNQLSPLDKESILFKALIINEDDANDSYKFNDSLDVKKEYRKLNLKEGNLINANLTKEAKENQLAYEPCLDDPQIVFSNLNLNGNKFLLRVFIESNSDYVGQIFWVNEEFTEFKESNSKTINVKKGGFEYEVKLDIDAINKLRIDIGTFNEFIEISDLEIEVYSSEDYLTDIDKITEESLDLSVYEDGYFKGKLVTRKDKILFINIPYDKGWHAYVDGKEQEIKVSSIAFMSIPVKKGQHEIEFKYIPPYIKIGAAISIFSLLVCIFISVKFRIRWMYLKLNKNI